MKDTLILECLVVKIMHLSINIPKQRIFYLKCLFV